ncbi:MAG: hypothetical protein AAFQ40_06795 [Cyanobacteria bacterium J06623_5]
MQTIQAKIQIGTDRTLQLQLPEDVPTGEYEVILVLNQSSSTISPTELSAIEKIQTLLQQSISPGHSLSDELIQERQEAAKHE